MATQSSATPGSGYGNQYIDSLVWGCQWTGGAVTYSFKSGGELYYDPNFSTYSPTIAWTSGERSMVRSILNSYENVCNIKFTEVADSTTANLVEVKIASFITSPSTLGMHDTPEGIQPNLYGRYATADWRGYEYSGSLEYFTVLHEIGHAIGLAHPHDGGTEIDASVFPGVTGPFDTGWFGLNQGVYTAMSYNQGWNAFSPSSSFNEAATPMAFDVAALQKIYGANTSYHTENNTYFLPSAFGWKCIWDAGGTHPISNEGWGGNCTINLNAATLYGAGAGGYISTDGGVGGYTIANGVIIENAIGGSGNDVFIGNAANNVLDGGGGTDRVQILDNSTALSKYGISSDGSVALVQSVAGGLDKLVNIENLTFNDISLVSLSSFMSGHPLFASNTDMGYSIPDVYSGPVTYLQYYLLGSGSGDTVIGGSTNDFMNLLGGDDAASGGSGNDVLDGGTGSNFLTGGAGADVFYLDGRGGTTTWGTITDFVRGTDKLDIWGWRPGVSKLALSVPSAGAAGYTGATLHYDLDGNNVIDTSVTFSGLSLTGLPSFITGTVGGNGYLEFS